MIASLATSQIKLSKKEKEKENPSSKALLCT
jgi:hypothetical protein